MTSAVLDISQTPRTPFHRLVSVELRKTYDTRASFWLLATIGLLVLAAEIIVLAVVTTQNEAISFGDFIFANYDLTILDCAPVTVGDRVLFGPGVTIATASHPIDFHQRAVEILEYAQPITIEEGAWIGARVVIGPGVTIGARAVIGAGSIVTRDVPADVVAVGNPCRVLRPITDADRDAYLATYGPSAV